jgi:hypothetical protein
VSPRGAPLWILLAFPCGCIDFSKLTQDYGKDAGLHTGLDSGVDGGPDAGPDAGTPCPSFAFFCEGFEGGNFNAWSPDPAAASFIALSVESGQKHSGLFAMEAAVRPPTGEGSGAENALIHRFPPISTGRLALRAWLRTDSRPGNYATWLWLSPDAGPLEGYTVGTGDLVDSPSEGWIVTREPLDAGRDHTSGVDPVYAQWQCVELVIDLPDAGSPGHVELFVDGTSRVAFDDATLDVGLPSYGALSVGVVRAQDDLDETRYLDDIALAAQRIGCN